MTESIANVDVTNEDEVLRHTQGLRLDVIRNMTEKGIPTDKESIDVILRAAADMDRAALGNKRIKTDDKNAAADRLAASAIAKMYSQLGNGDPFAVGNVGTGGKPAHPDVLVDGVKPMEGEMEIGVSSETYDQFQQRVEAT